MVSRKSEPTAVATEAENLIVIDKSDMPSGTYSVAFEEPLYEDYIKARRRFPANTGGQQNQSAPYSLEELLVAQQIRKVNGVNVPSVPQDIAEILKPFLIEDLQYLSLVFFEAYMLDNETARSARILGSKLRSSESLIKTVHASQLPAGSHTITFHTPNKGTNMEVERRYQGAQTNGCTLEEMMTAFCIATIDGQPVEHSKDIISIFTGWPIIDVQYLTLVFVDTFTLDDSGASKGRELGKSLRQKFLKRVSATEGSDTSMPVLEETKAI